MREIHIAEIDLFQMRFIQMNVAPIGITHIHNPPSVFTAEKAGLMQKPEHLGLAFKV